MDSPDYVSTALDARYEELVGAEGETRAETLTAIATGKATPLGYLADKWLSEKPIKPRQKLDYRRAVSNLEAWLTVHDLPQTVEAVTKVVVSDYRAEAFIKSGMHPRSANKSLSVLRGFGSTLRPATWSPRASTRGVGQFITGAVSPGTGASAEKRPFKDAEISRLLAYLARPERTPMQALIHDATLLISTEN